MYGPWNMYLDYSCHDDNAICHSIFFTEVIQIFQWLINLPVYWLKSGVPEITNQTDGLLGSIPCNTYNKQPLAWINSLRLSRNRRYLADDIFKCISLTENVLISIKISLKFITKCQINIIPALVQILAWRRPGVKPLYEPMMIIILTHMCVTRPQWVNNVTKCRTVPFWYSITF